MPLRSMTGFGRGTATAGGVSVELEISSVNRKQLDIRVGLPRELASLEARVCAQIQEAVTRGSVAVTVRLVVTGMARRKCVSVDREAARQFVTELRRTARELGLGGDLTARDLLELPDVVTFEPVPRDTEKVWRVLRRALAAALRELNAMRLREGETLQADLVGRLHSLSAIVARIRKRSPRVIADYRRSLVRRIEEAGAALDEADASLMREIVIFADRADITEELVRLESHLMQAGKLLTSRGPVGRTLDFLCQELLREINTLGSKANDIEIATQAVRFKALLESVREQVQNVE